MPRIRFSHRYLKMHQNANVMLPKYAVLLDLYVTNAKDLHPVFVEYDTKYYECLDKIVWKNYKLPEGKVMVLLLLTDMRTSMMMWTTIRRHTEAKHAYYRQLVGETFEIVVDDEQVT